MVAFTREELDRLVDRSSLPGIDPTELRVTREWIRREGAKYDELRFAVRVGEGIELVGDYTAKFVDDWRERTKMKLDLVAMILPDDATLLEAKVQWTNDAVWQLLGYRDHYAREHPAHRLRLVGVCEAYTPSAATLATAFGIRLHVYGFPPDLPQAAATTETEP